MSRVHSGSRLSSSLSGAVFISLLTAGTLAPAQVPGDSFDASAGTINSPTCQFGEPTYTPNGIFTVQIPGALETGACPGTTYDITATAVVGSDPVGGTPPFVIPNFILGATSAGSPYLFINAGVGTFLISVLETGACNPTVNPVVFQVVVPDAAQACTELSLSKSGEFVDTSGNGLADPGEPINYVLSVANTGSTTTLTNIVVSDPLLASVICPSGNPIPSLVPGASEICTGSHALTGMDLMHSAVHNVATATADQDSAQAEAWVVLPRLVPALTVIGLGLTGLALGVVAARHRRRRN